MIDPVELSQKLIRCQSVTPEDGGALDLVEKSLTSIGFTCHRLPFSEKGTEKVDNLYARYGTKKPNLCFAGHTDVVPVGDVAGWEGDPFGGEIKNGNLIGRGAVDMKPAIAAWIAAVDKFIKKNKKFEGSLSFLITGDEEDVAINGTKKVLSWMEEQGEEIDACVVGEPTNPEKLGEMVKIGRRGTMGFVLTVNGIQGHVAYPDLADNPVKKLIDILHRLTHNKLDHGTEFFPPSNLEVTSVDVGNKASNIIPAKATAKFNVRFNDNYDVRSIVSWVKAYCGEVTSQYILTHEKGSDSFLTQPGFLSKAVTEAVKKITGISPELSTTGGTSDARFIKDVCPVVEFGLINKTAHKVNEQIAVEDINKLSEIYGEIIELYFKG